jgi:hypothetical protein
MGRFAFARTVLAAAVVIAFFNPAISHSLAGIGQSVVDAFIGVGHIIANTLDRHPSETAFSLATVVIRPLAVKSGDAWNRGTGVAGRRNGWPTSVSRLSPRPRILLCMRHGLVKCRHPCPSIVGRGIYNANLLDMTCWLLRQDHSDGTVRTRCDESPARSCRRLWRHRWRRVRTRLRPRRPTWFSRTSEDLPRLVLTPPRK